MDCPHNYLRGNQSVNIQIINTGKELLLGHVLNTHQQWLCRQLADLGYMVNRQVAVDDSGPAIQEAAREALAVADLVITTGGLGPTSDDRTRDLIAESLGRELHEDAKVLAHIAEFFAARKRPMPERTRVQALVPKGAIVLANAHGTAPGLVLDLGDDVGITSTSLLYPSSAQTTRRPTTRAPMLVMLPGPPRELRPMFTEQVIPLIRQRFPLEEAFVWRTLKTTGLGESLVEERIARPLKPLIDAGLELGYCARVGEVEVRFGARGSSAEEAVREAERIVRELMGEYIFGCDDDQLEAVVVRLLTERKQTLALAESCTGGCIAHRLTNVPGASAVFLAGLVTYSNESKQTLLGVGAQTLVEQGAVSEPVVREMAEGARSKTGADYGLAVTGIAGPTGGSADKPIGTVWIGLATATKTSTRRWLNPYDRETFKFITSQQALDMLRREILD